jgi:hypothetical protein
VRSFVVVVLFLFIGSNSHAQYGGSNGAHFSFSITAGTPGCATVSYINTYDGFPTLPKGTVTEVRFFHSNDSAQAVTVDSQFEETSLHVDDQNTMSVTPNQFCGLKPGHYFFKYGLYDTNNRLLEFMDPGNFDQYSNTVDIAELSA